MRALGEKILPLIRRFGPPAISYGVPALLFLAIAFETVSAAIFGVDPAPQIPPYGYVANENRVTLHWRKGDVQGELTVEVAQGRDFDNPVFSARSKSEKLVLPRLDPGHEYCWRVRRADDDGGPYSCFSTSEMTVTY
jgi:hypothetical protein